MDLITRIWEDLGGRVGGPMTFRLILQPTMAAIFAVRGGVVDAHAGRSPYFWSILHDPAHRRYLIEEGWKDVARIFGLGVVMDLIYQVTVFRWVYPGEVLIVAFLLACLPYLVIRGLTGRIARRVQPRKEVV